MKVDVCENIIKLDISKNKTNTAYVQHIFSFFFFFKCMAAFMPRVQISFVAVSRLPNSICLLHLNPIFTY